MRPSPEWVMRLVALRLVLCCSFFLFQRNTSMRPHLSRQLPCLACRLEHGWIELREAIQHAAALQEARQTQLGFAAYVNPVGFTVFVKAKM
jgi:hypothetical protein